MVAGRNDNIRMTGRIVPIDISNALHTHAATHNAGNMRHGVCHTRRGVAAGRLAQDLLGLEFGQLLQYRIAIQDVGNDQDIFYRH